MDDVYTVTGTMVVPDGGFFATGLGPAPVYYPKGCKDFCAQAEDGVHPGAEILSCDGPVPIETYCDPPAPPDGGCSAFDYYGKAVFDGGVTQQFNGFIPDGGQAIQCHAKAQVQNPGGGGCGPPLAPTY